MNWLAAPAEQLWKVAQGNRDHGAGLHAGTLQTTLVMQCCSDQTKFVMPRRQHPVNFSIVLKFKVSHSQEWHKIILRAQGGVAGNWGLSANGIALAAAIYHALSD